MRTFDLESADAFIDKVIGEEELGDGALLEIFGNLSLGEALLQQGDLVRLEPPCRLAICHEPVQSLVSSSLCYFLQVLLLLLSLFIYMSIGTVGLHQIK